MGELLFFAAVLGFAAIIAVAVKSRGPMSPAEAYWRAYDEYRSALFHWSEGDPIPQPPTAPWSQAPTEGGKP